MSENNKLINEEKSYILKTYLKSYVNENITIFNFPISKLVYYRIKLGFFFLILIHLIFKVIDDLEFEWENKKMCIEKDPIWMFEERLEVERDIICKSENSTNFCYKNTLENYQSDKGVICKMKNFILDPSKWQKIFLILMI